MPQTCDHSEPRLRTRQSMYKLCCALSFAWESQILQKEAEEEYE